jgi:phage RecT family recombinase
MAENQQVAKMNPLKKLEMEIEQSPNIRGAVMLAQDRWVKNYQLVTGKKDGAQRFQTELLNYMDIVNEFPALQKCEKFSHFAAVMKAATTGLSFKSDGHLYVIPYGNRAKVQIGAHGKREMMRMMPEIKFISEGQVVMKGDDFSYDKINSKVVKHLTTEKSSTRNNLEDVMGSYVRIEWKDGRIIDVYMSREELLRAMEKSSNKGPNSVWQQWPLEMSKKVPYHRAKKLYHRFPDGVIDFGGEAPDDVTDVPHQDIKEEATSQPLSAIESKSTGEKESESQDFQEVQAEVVDTKPSASDKKTKRTPSVDKGAFE